MPFPSTGKKWRFLLCFRLIAGTQPPDHGGTGHPARRRRLHGNRQRVLQRGRPQQVGADRGGPGVDTRGVRGSGQVWGAVEALVGISRDGEGRKGGALGSAHVCAGVSAHCARQGSRVGMLLGHPHPSRAASLCCSFSSLWLRTTRGLFPQRGGWEAVGCRRTVPGTNPPLLLHFEPPPTSFLPPRSPCSALQVYREDHGGDGAVVSSGHHPTLCQQPRSGGAHLPRAELQQAGARPAKPPAPLLVSPCLATIPKEGGFPES